MDYKRLAPAVLPILMASTALVDPTLVEDNPILAALIAALVAFFTHLAPSPVKK